MRAIADFDGDGRDDVVWNDPGSRLMSLWRSTGTGFAVFQIGGYGPDWRLLGAADVTGERLVHLKSEKGAPITGLALSPDGKRVAWGDEDGNAGVAEIG